MISKFNKFFRFLKVLNFLNFLKNSFFKFFRFFTIKILYILFVFLGQISEKLKLKLFEKYLKFNNYFTLKIIKNYKNNIIDKDKKLKILILLPHCLQYSKCIYKITFDINNCRKCMKCIIGNFLILKEKNENLYISVATGGTLARRKIKEYHPNIIIAVACERDLISGIFDAYPFFVYGVFNERPNGDCIDTMVDFTKILSFLDILKQ